ncbi:aldehyde dehydrogenase EutE [Telmatospirillum siberiense]|uniref:Aldehyde dehydrogenase EutE n=2 Tax=Telmatospirillum siberiense TaxID=382514 RepID=A0A2N3PUP2_9PROT|nr:aldehyde dehydrogenase EutE [Telmatospirillum siberiense]
MNADGQQIATLVRKVLDQLVAEGPLSPVAGCDGIFATIDDAVEAAVAAQRKLLPMTLLKRKEIIANIRGHVLENNERIARLAVEETHLGRVEDKIRENILCAEKTPGVEDIQPVAISGDHGLMLLEYAPVGIIGALTPITNPTGTIINNAISMISAGNSVVFNCHPSARETSRQVVRLIHRAIVAAGGPAGLVGMVEEPTLDTARDLVAHPKINLLVATGGRAVVDVVLRSGKKAIGAGAGNPPCLVDETANIRRAAECIVNGASINNNIFCICEKEVIVVREVENALVKFIQETGRAYLLSDEESARVTKLVVNDGAINAKYIGKDVQIILRDVGINVDEACRLAIFRAPPDHPLVWKEQMMPVLPIVCVEGVQEGIELAVKVEKGNRHTAIMHSTNVENMTAFARAIQTTIFVKNAPCYAGIGLGGEGHTSFTIAGPTGEGLTSARTFTRQRRCVLSESFRII